MYFGINQIEYYLPIPNLFNIFSITELTFLGFPAIILLFAVSPEIEFVPFSGVMFDKGEEGIKRLRADLFCLYADITQFLGFFFQSVDTIIALLTSSTIFPI